MGKKRLIDADELVERLKEKCEEYSEDLEYEAPGLRLLDESIKSGISYSIMQVYMSPTVLEYSDEPLSLEELKNINGKYPVWIDGLNDKGFSINEYAILEKDTETNFYVKFIGYGLGHSVNHKNYGKTWFAYLRKPYKEK